MEDRERLIRERIEGEDFVEMMQLRGVKQIVWDILIKEKEFDRNEILIDPQFKIRLSDCEAVVGVDFVIELPPVSFAVIQCANAGLEFWERYVIAFARSVKDYQIPYAMVTNGNEAKIMDVVSGVQVSENIKDFYNRQEALNIVKDFRKIPCPEKRLEKEKRIIYAFEGVKCPTSKQSE